MRYFFPVSSLLYLYIILGIIGNKQILFAYTLALIFTKTKVSYQHKLIFETCLMLVYSYGQLGTSL